MNALKSIKSNTLRIIHDPDYRLILVIFIPIFIDMIMNNIIGTLHSYFVAGLGDNAISAISLASQANNLFATLFQSLASALAVIISQFKGAGDLDGAKKCVSQTICAIILISSAVGAVLYFFPYQVFHAFFGRADHEIEQLAVIYLSCIALSLPFYGIFQAYCNASRGFGNNKIPLYISVSGSVVNLIFAYVFINVFHLGIAGAGLGHIISRIYMTLIGTVIFTKQGWLTNFKETIKVNFRLLSKIVILGLNISSESIIVSIGGMIKINFLISFGASHLSASSITGTFQSLCAVPVTVLGTVAVTLIGRYIGANDIPEAKSILKKILKCSYTLYIATTLVSLAVLPFIYKGYTQSEETLELLQILLYINTIMLIFVTPGLNVFLAGFKASGDAFFNTLISMCCMWIINVGMGYVFVSVFNLGVVGAVISTNLSAIAKFIIVLLRYKSGKWIHKRMV